MFSPVQQRAGLVLVLVMSVQKDVSSSELTVKGVMVHRISAVVQVLPEQQVCVVRPDI